MKSIFNKTLILVLLFTASAYAAEDMIVHLRTAKPEDQNTVEKIENKRSIASESPVPVPVKIVDLSEVKPCWAEKNKTRYEENKSKDIFEAYAKACRAHSLDECKKAASFIKADQNPEILKTKCSKESSFCSILGYWYLQQGQQNKAKDIFKDLCLKKSFPQDNSWLMCDEATKLIKLPEDAQKYSELESECQQWANEPEGEEESTSSDKGKSQACQDRVQELERLKEKYRGQDDIIFRLDHHPVL